MTRREDAFLHMLDAAVNMQRDISLILEANAVESEKARNWILNHMHAAEFITDEDQIKEPLLIHKQVIEMIEVLTKLETGLCNNLKAILSQESGGDSHGGGFSGRGDMEDYEK